MRPSTRLDSLSLFVPSPPPPPPPTNFAGAPRRSSLSSAIAPHRGNSQALFPTPCYPHLTTLPSPEFATSKRKLLHLNTSRSHFSRTFNRATTRDACAHTRHCQPRPGRRRSLLGPNYLHAKFRPGPLPGPLVSERELGRVCANCLGHVPLRRSCPCPHAITPHRLCPTSRARLLPAQQSDRPEYTRPVAVDRDPPPTTPLDSPPPLLSVCATYQRPPPSWPTGLVPHRLGTRPPSYFWSRLSLSVLSALAATADGT